MDEYEWKIVDDYIVKCDCCHSEVPVRTFNVNDDSNPGAHIDAELCEICSTTMASNYWQFANLYKNSPLQKITQHQSQCTNMILQQIGKFGNKPNVA